MNKKTVLITGASRGIGRATALEFASCGYDIAVNYFKSEEQAKALMKEITEKYNVKCKIYKADVSVSEEVDKMFSLAEKEIGKIFVLVNNAAISEQKLFTDLSDNDIEKMLSVNLKGQLYAARRAIPNMVNEKYGKIINIASIWGEVGASCEVHYSASKAAVIGFTKALAKELGPSNINVNCISPGVINTDMNSSLSEETLNELKEETPLGRVGSAKEIAKGCVFLASESAEFITGQIIGINGGFVI